MILAASTVAIVAIAVVVIVALIALMYLLPVEADGAGRTAVAEIRRFLRTPHGDPSPDFRETNSRHGRGSPARS